MNFYIKNTEATEVVDEKIYMNLPEYDEFKKFIQEGKHAMGYINEKYDDFVLLCFSFKT